MNRERMEWDWVKNYPIFTYMRFIDYGKWSVKVVKGVKGNQNSGNTSPSALAWFEYITDNLISRRDVCKDAYKRAKWKLEAELRKKVELV
jgi:hypothetical protein